MQPSRNVVALDIGGSHVTAAMVDLDSRAIIPGTRTRIATAAGASADMLLAAWAGAAQQAATVAPERSVGSLALAMPAPFDYAAGIAWMEHKFQALYGLNVVAQLSEWLGGTALAGRPIRVANDADLFALGEWWAGAGRGYERVIGLTVGTGLGSGFIRGGQIVTGGPDVPPESEIWNIPYGDGIVEDYASGGAVTRVYAQATGQHCSAAEIAARAGDDDPAAQAAFRQLGRHLAGIVQLYSPRFQPDCVVVGGNVARAWAWFGDDLQAVLQPIACHPSLRFDDAALLGAAALGADQL